MQSISTAYQIIFPGSKQVNSVEGQLMFNRYDLSVKSSKAGEVTQHLTLMKRHGN